jgi:hypothetical protein
MNYFRNGKQKLRDCAFRFHRLRRSWTSFRGHQIERQYRRWMEEFGAKAEAAKLLYDPAESFRLAREPFGLPLRVQKRAGEVHSAIVTLTRNWGQGMIYELEVLGTVTVIDWEHYGYYEADPVSAGRIVALNDILFTKIREAHSNRPIDWILFTCNGGVILKATVRRIREELGIPTVNQWLDCKHTFVSGRQCHGQDTGICDIAPEFDLSWTSAPSTCSWYLAVGAKPVFLPEGYSERLLPRLPRNEKVDVVFLGARYGARPDYIMALRRAGLTVQTAGPGWAESVPVPMNAMAEFFCSGKVCLGIGGVGYSDQLTTLKGRDFEVPGSGGTYLTTFNPDLVNFFDVGTEIVCYRTVDEMVELARQLVRDEARRVTVGNRAAVRATFQHRWVHRFADILNGLGILEENSAVRARRVHSETGRVPGHI